MLRSRNHLFGPDVLRMYHLVPLVESLCEPKLNVAHRETGYTAAFKTAYVTGKNVQVIA